MVLGSYAEDLLRGSRESAHLRQRVCPDQAIELVLACDASPYGVGAVLSHQFSDIEEKLIIFASCSQGAAERKYSHFKKKGLAIVFGVKKCHQ